MAHMAPRREAGGLASKPDDAQRSLKRLPAARGPFAIRVLGWDQEARLGGSDPSMWMDRGSL